MQKQSTVSDYVNEARLPLDVFLERYSHPFLVIINKMADDNDEESESGSFFFTKAFLSLEDKNATLGGGPMLDPDAAVLPVKKRHDATSGKSALATTIMVGRNDDNDVVMNYTGVSKYHFYIAALPFTEDEYTISDNGSTNGTFVNMQKIQPAKRVPLKSGDRITVGHIATLRFYLAKDFWETIQQIL